MKLFSLLTSVCFLALSAGLTLAQTVMSNTVDLQLLKVIQDSANTNYVVRAKIYPEDPNSLFLTMRGRNQSGENGGVSVYDVSNASEPKFLTHWDADNDLDNTVEGQDRANNTLVVVAINTGKLYVFDVSDPSSLNLLASLQLTGVGIFQKFRALHTKIYQAGDGKIYALVTAPSATKLIAVDITDPAQPQQVSDVLMSVAMVESVYLKGHYAYCGGFASSNFAVIDISDINNMQLKKTLQQDYYKQMVSELDPRNSNILYSSAWGKPGGLIAFDLSNPAEPTELSKVISSDLDRSNRVKIRNNYAYLPLERDPGGVGIVDISNPNNLTLVRTVTGIAKVKEPYALAIKDDYLYVFGTQSSSMAIMQIVNR